MSIKGIHNIYKMFLGLFFWFLSCHNMTTILNLKRHLPLPVFETPPATSAGIDEREKVEKEFESFQLNSIEKKMQKKKVLDMLTSPHISQKDKERGGQTVLETRTFAPRCLQNGGLLKDWFFQM